MPVDAYPLSLLLLIPAIGAAVVCLLPSERDRLLKWAAFIASLATFLWSAVLFRNFDNQAGSFQMVEQADWFRAAGFRVQYYLGVDGISLLLVLPDHGPDPLGAVVELESQGQAQALPGLHPAAGSGNPGGLPGLWT